MRETITQQIAGTAITDTVFWMQILRRETCNKADAVLAALLSTRRAWQSMEGEIDVFMKSPQ